MKTFLFLLLCSMASLFPNEELVRISPHEVVVSGTGIYIVNNEAIVQIPFLCSDSQGLYFLKGSEIDIGVVWTCGICGRWNWGGDDVCRHCGAERDKY